MLGAPSRRRPWIALAFVCAALFGASAASAQTADMLILKSGPGSAAANSNVTYTLNVANIGPDSASSVVVTDPIPGGMTFVNLTSPPGWSCTTPPVGFGGTVTCETASLAAAANANLSITLAIPAATAPGTFFTNIVTVSSGTFDPNDENNASTTATVVSGGTSADVAVFKSGPATIQAGQNITYTIQAQNNGPDAATAVTLTDTLAGNLTFVSLTAPGGWSCTTPAVGGSGTISCTIASLAAAAGGTFTLVANVPGGTPDGTFYENFATISTSTNDPATENNESTAGTLVLPTAPDLTIAKTHSGNAQAGQTGFAYTITVSNTGAAPSSGTVTVQDTLPAGLTATSISGTGWSCTLATLTCTRADALAASASYPAITLLVNVSPAAPSGVVNVATVSGGGDGDTSNNTATDATTVTPAPVPDLTIAKTHTGNAQAGQTGFSYTITVTNAGVAPSAGTVTVQDTLPAGLTATSISGTGWSCTLGTLTCTRADALAASASFPPITLLVDVSPAAPSTVTNVATVSGGGDGDNSNNTAADVTTVAAAPGPDLAIAKTHTGNATRGQTGFAYTISVRNAGVGTTTGTVTVSDTIPVGLTAAAASGSGWTCSLGATVTCTRADALAPAATYPAITLTVNVAADAPPTVTNVATVSVTGDTNAANNTATDPTTVNAGGADLAIAKTHAGTPRAGQIGFVYTITVNNAGTIASSGAVTVTDVLPAGLTATAITGAGWSCSLGATPSCTRSDALAAGAAYPAITLTVNIAGNVGATITNVATVSGGGDTNAANNTAIDIAAVKPRPDPTKDPDVVGLVNSQLAASQRFANAQTSNFNERLEALRDDNTGDQFGLRFGGNGDDDDPCKVQGINVPLDPFDPKCKQRSSYTADGSASDPFAYAPDRTRMVSKAPPKTAPRPTWRDYAFWSTGYVSFGSVDPTAQRSGVDFNTTGVSAGIDYRFSRLFVAGIGVGYGRDSSKIGDRGTRSDGETFNIAGYGSLRPFRNFFLDGVLGYGALRFHTQRFVVDDNAFVFGARDGRQYFASLTAAWEWRWNGTVLSPYGRINAAWLTLDAFTEAGGFGGALTYSQQTAEFYTAVLGLRGKHTFLTDWGSIAPRFRVEYHHDFSGESTVLLQYADLLSPVYTLTTNPIARDRASFGVGTDLVFLDIHRLAFDYSHDTDFRTTSWHRFRVRWDARF